MVSFNRSVGAPPLCLALCWTLNIQKWPRELQSLPSWSSDRQMAIGLWCEKHKAYRSTEGLPDPAQGFREVYQPQSWLQAQGSQLNLIRYKKSVHMLARRAGKEAIKGKTIRNLTLVTGTETQLHQDTLPIHFSSPLVSAQMCPLPLHVVGKMAIYLHTQTQS